MLLMLMLLSSFRILKYYIFSSFWFPKKIYFKGAGGELKSLLDA